MIYQKGNTVTIKATFYDDDNKTAIDPDVGTIKFKLYDSKYQLLSSTNLGDANKISTGIYKHLFTSQNVGQLIYELYGEINGVPCLKRSGITIVEV